MRKLLYIFILCLFSGCYPGLNAPSNRYYRKHIKDSPTIMYAHREAGGNIQMNFTLRKNKKYAYTSFAWGEHTVKVGDWKISNDTIYLTPYKDHYLADYMVLRCHGDSSKTKKQNCEFYGTLEWFHQDSAFNILEVISYDPIIDSL